MTDSAEKRQPRKLETEIEIAAPMDAVWKALSEAEELTRWFPIEARVNPGPGGSIAMAWPQQGTVWESRIEIWEPHRRLRTIGVPRPVNESSVSNPAPLVVDYLLESRGGTTVVRLVHSGFRYGSSWEDEYYESFRRGWDFELRGLRHYLERHPGERRWVACAREEFQIPFEEAWARLMGRRGILRQGWLGDLREGDRYAVSAGSGDIFEGVVQVNEPPKQFSGTMEDANNSLLRVKLDRSSEWGEATVWLSTYGLPRAEVDAFQNRWRELLRGLLR